MRRTIQGKSVLQTIAPVVIVSSLVGIFVLHLLALVYTPSLNLDVAYFLTAGQMLLKGARPYVDLVDVNFPLIIYLSWIPAALSQLARIPLPIAGNFFLFCLVVSTMFLFGKMLNIVIPRLTVYQTYCIYIVWLASSLWIYQHGDFGQREQLIVLFLSPLILLRFARYAQIPVPRALAIVSAVFGSYGIGLKPFYLFPVLVIEVIFLWKFRRLLQPLLALEIPLGVGLGIMYLTHFYLIPGMSVFYTYWLGTILRGYATYYAMGSKGLLQTLLLGDLLPYLHVYLLLALGLGCLVWYRNHPLFLLSSCYGWFACGAFGLYIWQAKGWPYQVIPLFYGVFIGLTLLFLAVHVQYLAASWQSLPSLALAAVCMVVLAYPAPYQLLSAPFSKPPFQFPRNAFVEVIEQLTTPEERVLILSPIVAPAFPSLTYTGRPHGGRFLCTYPLTFFFNDSAEYVPNEQWKEDDVKFYDMLQDDLHRFKPRVILINTRDRLPALPPYFKISEYLRRKGFYDLLAASYEYVGDADRFEIYRRKD